MRARRIPFALPLLVALSGCTTPNAVIGTVEREASRPEPLYMPPRIVPGRLAYAPDRSTFAPILTERFPYPTQPQANAAYRRLVAAAPPGNAYPSSIRLFGCKPGALDEQTARVARYPGPVVHCATDFLDPNGRVLWRETSNFFYHREVWMMQALDPPRAPVAWRDREGSPTDPWWWVPGRSRYE